MTNNVTVIEPQMNIEIVPVFDTSPVYVHKTAIANVANSLIVAYSGGPEVAAVMNMARALGCAAKVVK